MVIDRPALARKRLSSHGIASARTLEQKISDAGPANQRINPHILTPARKTLVDEGQVIIETRGDTPWFHLADTPTQIVQQRLNEQLPIHDKYGKIGQRMGQCLEIAIYRSLLRQDNLEYLGGFTNLEEHDDSRRYRKEEPPSSLSGKRMPGDQKLDFLVRHPTSGWAAIEAKNVREWLYPDREEILNLLKKAIALDCVPVLIARRFAFVTFKVLSTCGVVFHQTYNQLVPESDGALAAQAREKRLLGYHDIRLGNQPDDRLVIFVTNNLLEILPEARVRFEEYKDLLEAFAYQNISYKAFSARVRRRSQGLYEEGDWDPPDDDGYIS